MKDAQGQEIGVVTSGTMSPSLRQGIALCLLDRGCAAGDRAVIDVRGRDIVATVVKPPFVATQVAD